MRGFSGNLTVLIIKLINDSNNDLYIITSKR